MTRNWKEHNKMLVRKGELCLTMDDCTRSAVKEKHTKSSYDNHFFKIEVAA